MIIESLRLENIRSYTEADVSFGAGTTLLAGDIGAGKSTILLAIEFALFGIRTGDLSGDALLRHGEKQGSVTLTFTTDRTYTVQRTLKRSSRGVRQDSGFLATGDEHEDLSAQEIKARILDILGYPEELLTKRKGFVFRYTVYTPQEEMKRIITEDDASRLDTLRSVFGVDKYRTITENASALAKAMRDDKRFLLGQLQDVAELQDDRDRLKQQHADVSESLKGLEQTVSEHADALETLEAEGERLRKEHEAQQERLQTLAAMRAKQQSISEQLQAISKQGTALEHRLAEEKQPVDDPGELLQQVREKRGRVAEKKAAAAAKLEALKEQRQRLTQDADGIDALEECPRCRQPVTDEHKSHIQEELDEKTSVLDERMEKVDAVISKVDHLLSELAGKETALIERKKLYDAYKEFEAEKKQAAQRKKELDEQQTLLQEQHRDLQERIAKAVQTEYDDTAYKEHKKRLQLAQQALKQAEVQRSSQKAKLQSIQEQLERVAARLADRKEKKQRLERLQEKERWLSQGFVPTTEIIEKHVLAAVHREFNRLFTQWFSTLIEDDSMYAELTRTFAPLVTQNGYDADIPYLSGGEKTSVALAYRLALNTVVNSLLRNVKTTDLLILDEPTDGFSTEQLDRVRIVLDELDCAQIIVVSHEQKMESYVDRVVAVRKEHGVSMIG